MAPLTQKLKSIVSKNKTKFQFFISCVLIFAISSVSYLRFPEIIFPCNFIRKTFSSDKKGHHCVSSQNYFPSSNLFIKHHFSSFMFLFLKFYSKL